MLAVLPVIAYWLLWRWMNPRCESWRDAALMAALVWGVYLTTVTEILSLFGWLTSVGLVVAWGAAVVGIVWSVFGRAEARPYEHTDNVGMAFWPSAGLIALLLIILITGITAFIAPPNTWDSMTYHMARVAHWVQNQSIDHYPASDLRQLYQHPWAEYAITHLYVLAGSDRFANMVQWAAMIGSLIGVSAITRLWGSGGIFAAVFCATIPMGILQASGSQNDYVTAFWLVCAVYFVLRYARRQEWRPYRSQRTNHRDRLLPVRENTQIHQQAAIGASLGLLVLTKATAYIYALPLLLWFVWIARHRWRHILIAGIVALALVAPHYGRNITVFGSPFGPHVESYANGVLSPAVTVSNLIRNIGLHVVLPGSLRDDVERGVVRIHDAIGIAIDDPRTTFPGETFALPAWTMHEDLAPAPLHLLLGIVGAGLCLWKQGPARVYTLTVVAAFVLFCTVLTWQPWHARLHLPFFVLLSPLVAHVLSERWRTVFGVLLLVIAVYPLFFNQNRAWMGQENRLWDDSLYFANMPGMEDDYRITAEQVGACSEIGLAIGSRGEYPLWILLEGRHIQHVNTPVLADTEYTPCAVIADPVITGETMRVNGTPFTRIWESETLAVLLPG